jgi:formylglycine-generating enzyme required for sulfatase activity
MRLVLIPPGEYLMGSTPQEIAAVIAAAAPSITPTVAAQVQAEGPQHRVVITQPFLLGETEVTIGQYAKFVKATSWKTGVYSREMKRRGNDCLCVSLLRCLFTNLRRGRLCGFRWRRRGCRVAGR